MKASRIGSLPPFSPASFDPPGVLSAKLLLTRLVNSPSRFALNASTFFAISSSVSPITFIAKPAPKPASLNFAIAISFIFKALAVFFSWSRSSLIVRISSINVSISDLLLSPNSFSAVSLAFRASSFRILPATRFTSACTRSSNCSLVNVTTPPDAPPSPFSPPSEPSPPSPSPPSEKNCRPCLISLNRIAGFTIPVLTNTFFIYYLLV
ncbi:hypothetical protein proCM3_gp42 [Bacillus phage proCM3]|nr:hypothetical protein proCM3_gp42 [Bacillus phage proCM3]